jgi:hypothetical protein
MGAQVHWGRGGLTPTRRFYVRLALYRHNASDLR